MNLPKCDWLRISWANDILPTERGWRKYTRRGVTWWDWSPSNEFPLREAMANLAHCAQFRASGVSWHVTRFDCAIDFARGDDCWPITTGKPWQHLHFDGPYPDPNSARYGSADQIEVRCYDYGLAHESSPPDTHWRFEVQFGRQALIKRGLDFACPQLSDLDTLEDVLFSETHERMVVGCAAIGIVPSKATPRPGLELLRRAARLVNDPAILQELYRITSAYQRGGDVARNLYTPCPDSKSMLAEQESLTRTFERKWKARAAQARGLSIPRVIAPEKKTERDERERRDIHD